MSTSDKSVIELLSKIILLFAPSTNGDESSPKILPCTSVIMFGTVSVPEAVISPFTFILPKPTMSYVFKSNEAPNCGD